MNDLLVYSILFATVIISGLSVYLVKINQNRLKLLLAFSGAYLFALSVTKLIPDIYANASASAGVYILIGFFFQLLLEFFSEGIEHGHMHLHHDDKHNHSFPFAVMAGLSIHSFLEGMPIAHLGAHGSGHAQQSFVTGIVLHNVPIAITLMTMFVHSHLKKSTAIFMLLVFAAITPLGMLVGEFIGNDSTMLLHKFYTKIMAVVVGIFLHISTTILFESNQNHRFNFIKFITIILGAVLALLVM